MRGSILAVVFWICCCCGLNAQGIRRPMAPTNLNLYTQSNLAGDVFACLTNQAGLARVKKLSVAVYGERRFMLSELALYYAGAILPTRFGTIGFKVAQYGFARYNEKQIGLAFGKALGAKVDVGIQFDYYLLKASGYGRAGTITAEAGILVHLTPQFISGFHISNPAGGKYGLASTEKLPFVYTATLVYSPSLQSLVSLVIEKEEQQPVNVMAVVAYRFADRLSARIGTATATGNYWLGIRVDLNDLFVEITAGYHQQLGFTPGLLFQAGGGTTSDKAENKSGAK